MSELTQPLAKAVEQAMKRLLSEKHLYQSIEIDLGFIPELAKKLPATLPTVLTGGRSRAPEQPTVEMLTPQVFSSAKGPWIPMSGSKESAFTIVGTVRMQIWFLMPTINTFCADCHDRWPFNPVFDGAVCVIGEEQSQWFSFGYQCQQCKGPAVRFLVRRQGLRLCLTGRDPIEALPPPNVLPKAPSKYYCDAQIAHHAGQTLAGLFLLRVFIEQFWRTLPQVRALLQHQPRATGDEQGDEYQKTLPEDFKNRFPSLPELYGKLSAAMHEAKPDAALFEESCARIVEHFDARKVYKLA